MSNILGDLLIVAKSRYYTGKSEITQKALYKVQYTAWFYNDQEKSKGQIHGMSYTFSHTEYQKVTLSSI